MEAKPNRTPIPQLVVTGNTDEVPSAMAERRTMITTAVQTAANPLIENINALRKQLDELETMVLENAAHAADNLNTHINICEAAQIEVHRLTGVVADMRKTQIRAAT